MLFRFGPIFAIIMLGVVSSGCLFEPRDPAPPGGEVIQYVDPSNPDNVLENMDRALNGLDPAGYERMLSDDFTYEPDGDTIANYPGVDWESWDREKEVAFITSFLSNVNGVVADLNAETIFGYNGSGTEAELRYIYEATVQELGGGEVPYRATVTLEFHIDGTYWVLTRWYDEQGEDSLPTLGQRRGAFAASGGG